MNELRAHFFQQAAHRLVTTGGAHFDALAAQIFNGVTA
ncbi:Uncharacterised protein [Acinetobacter baumannii]|nr:Uncharacterised protein [Acinetobacter baumannii]